jgi:BirA family biotin operon repressor/biotin-[acetyl-CoA-carboxylase] ligase
MSVLWRPAPEPAHRATQLVGLAVCRVARRHGVDAAMKWPNDVVVAESKLAGVLAQAVPDGVVVGVGVNVTWAPPGAALLGVELDPVAVGLEVLDELAAAIDAPDEVSTAAYRAALSTLQRRVRVELPGGTTLDGRAIEVESDGHLVVLDACGISHRVDAGDVIHLRPSSPEVESDS